MLQPCGFLDVACGDLRGADFDVRSLYETGPDFVALRDVNAYRGKCGRCQYRRVCGGCRGRAFAATGDFLAEDPACSYVPQKLRGGVG